MEQVAEKLDELNLATSSTANGNGPTGNDSEDADVDVEGVDDDDNQAKVSKSCFSSSLSSPSKPGKRMYNDEGSSESDEDVENTAFVTPPPADDEKDEEATPPPPLDEAVKDDSTEKEDPAAEEGDAAVDRRPPPPPVPASQLAWSWTATFKERQLNLLRFGFFSDFTVLLGEDKQKVLVHKSVLASSSLILYHEVLKVLSEGINVLHLNEDPRIFTLFLQYLYTGECGVGFKDAFSLQVLAKKYQVPDLEKQCKHVIKSEEFTLDTAFLLLPLAMNSSHETLLEALLNFVCKNGSVFVKDERFLSLPESVVLEIVKRDDLDVKHEMEVLSAVVHWGQHQCKLKQIDEKNPANFGQFLTGFLRHIRFPCDFAPKFWLPHLEKSGTKNTNQILRDIFSPRHHFDPYNKMVRRFSEPMCLVHSRYSGEGNGTPLMQWRCKNARVRLKETLMFLVNFPFTFFGFSIVKGVFGENFDKNVYDYSELTVQTTIVTSHSVTPQVDIEFDANPKPELRVHFEQPIDVPAHKWVTLIIVFGGHLKVKPKLSNGGFQKILISNCQLHVGTGMTSDHNTTLIPMEVKMILPIMCEFRRASTTGGDQLPIDKGYIESLLFSLNRPHPQGKDTSREQTSHLPFLCAFD